MLSVDCAFYGKTAILLNDAGLIKESLQSANCVESGEQIYDKRLYSQSQASRFRIEYFEHLN